MTILVRWLIGALLLAVVAGCDGVELNALDRRFESLYFAKVEGTRAGDELSVAPALFGLAKLSDEAQAAGDAAVEKDWRTAVAFYRIAALSAWQAGERGSQQIFTVSDKGRALCQNRLAEAPRDCTLMLLIAPLAVHDELAPALRPLNAKAETDSALDAADLATLVAVFDGVARQFEKVTETKSITAATDAPQAMLLYIDRQRFLMFCTAKAARDLMFLADGEQGPAALDQRGETLAAMEDSVRKPAGLAGCP